MFGKFFLFDCLTNTLLIGGTSTLPGPFSARILTRATAASIHNQCADMLDVKCHGEQLLDSVLVTLPD
jgi:hypothetical protein